MAETGIAGRCRAAAHVTIRVYLCAPGCTAGCCRPVRDLALPGQRRRAGSEPPVVYVPGFTGALYLEQPAEIQRYQEVCTGVAAAALDEPASRALIRRPAWSTGALTARRAKLLV